MPGWGPPGGFPGPIFGRGPKVGRGDVRIGVLALLAEGDLNGYQIIQQLGERSQGVWRPSPGSVYPTLQQLEDEGLVRAEESESRRAFRLTDDGRSYLAAHRDDVDALWRQLAGAADQDVVHLHDLAMQVGAAVMQIAHAGSASQLSRARTVLANTRRALYLILADGETTDSSPPDETADAPPGDN